MLVIILTVSSFCDIKYLIIPRGKNNFIFFIKYEGNQKNKLTSFKI